MEMLKKKKSGNLFIFNSKHFRKKKKKGGDFRRGRRGASYRYLVPNNSSFSAY